MRLVLIAAVLFLTSCDKMQPVEAKASLAAAVHEMPPTHDYQRFIPISQEGRGEFPLIKLVPVSYLALDTATGMLCKTWDWNVPGSELNGLDACLTLALPAIPH